MLFNTHSLTPSYKKIRVLRSAKKMSSARVFSPEEDQRARVTKKVKTRETELGDKEITMKEAEKSSEQLWFREALLNAPGMSKVDDGFGKGVPDEEMPENRWYKEGEDYGRNPNVIPEIVVTDAEIEEWSDQWSQTLMINVMGKRVNFRALEHKLNREWARVGLIQIIDMSRGYYAVRFGAIEDYNHALMEGPWMIADHYILVQRWRRNFLISAREERRIAVWVRIHELPLELYNTKFLRRLGANLGVMLKIDRLTSIHSRGQFARICVEIDLAKPVTPQVVVRGEILKLEYEGLHTICFHCGVYGHRESECLLKQAMKTDLSSEADRGPET